MILLKPSTNLYNKTNSNYYALILVQSVLFYLIPKIHNYFSSCDQRTEALLPREIVVFGGRGQVALVLKVFPQRGLTRDSITKTVTLDKLLNLP